MLELVAGDRGVGVDERDESAEVAERTNVDEGRLVARKVGLLLLEEVVVVVLLPSLTIFIIGENLQDK